MSLKTAKSNMMHALEWQIWTLCFPQDKDKIGGGKIRIRLSYPPQRDVIESGWIILEDRMIGLFSLCSSRDGVDGAQNHITQVHQSTQVHKNTTNMCSKSNRIYKATRFELELISWSYCLFSVFISYFGNTNAYLTSTRYIWEGIQIYKRKRLLREYFYSVEEVGRPLVICHTDARPSDAWSTWCGVRTLKLLMITSPV